MKRIVILTAFFSPFWGLGGFSLHANDTITLTWQGGKNKLLRVHNIFYGGIYYKVYIDWGDGLIDTIIDANVAPGVGKRTHTYADTTRTYNVNITANEDSVILAFYCPSQQISRLNVSRCAGLHSLYCSNNRLPLSELYKISEMSLYLNTTNFGLGTQRLLPQRILVGSSVDFSDQNEFDGIFTNYNLIKNSRTV